MKNDSLLIMYVLKKARLINFKVTLKGVVKLIDFGFSVKVKDNEKLDLHCGTP